MKAQLSPYFAKRLTYFCVLIIFVFIFWAIILSRFTQLTASTRVLNESLDYLKQSLAIIEHQSNTINLPILVYHYVEIVTDRRDTIRQTLSITPKIFESQLITLVTHGYQAVTLTQLTNYFEKGADLPQNPIIITFDDGYRDFYTDVLPIIKKHQIPVVLYQVAGYLDTTPNYLTSEQLLQIHKSGFVEIAAHSLNHSQLSQLSTEQARQQIGGSKRFLEQILNTQIDHFAYPFGQYSNNLINLVREAGFKTAASTDMGTSQSFNQRFVLKRIRPGSLTGGAFLKLLNNP